MKTSPFLWFIQRYTLIPCESINRHKVSKTNPSRYWHQVYRKIKQVLTLPSYQKWSPCVSASRRIRSAGTGAVIWWETDTGTRSCYGWVYTGTRNPTALSCGYSDRGSVDGNCLWFVSLVSGNCVYSSECSLPSQDWSTQSRFPDAHLKTLFFLSVTQFDTWKSPCHFKIQN